MGWCAAVFGLWNWEKVLFWILIIGVVLLGLVAVLNAFFPGVLSDEGAQMGLTHNILLLALVGSSVILGYRGRMGAALKHALAWIAIALVLVLLYSYRDVFSSVAGRVGGELMPSRPAVTANGDIELRATDGGHFLADAWVNGAKIRFLVDTGATTMALAPNDAERAGFDLEALRFNRPIDTANGLAYGASVRLDQVELGSILVQDIGATVMGEGLNQSLLGMNFLDRLSGFERRGDILILRP